MAHTGDDTPAAAAQIHPLHQREKESPVLEVRGLTVRLPAGGDRVNAID